MARGHVSAFPLGDATGCRAALYLPGEVGRAMIVWSKRFPRWKYPLGYLRLLRARQLYWERIGFGRKPKGGWGFYKKPGHRERLAELWNSRKGKRCFIIGNGPSLQKMDLSPLRNELTIGFNGIYKAFPEWGWHTDFLLFEDIEQTEIRGPEIPSVRGPQKMSAIYNAYAFRHHPGMLYMNCRYIDRIYWKSLRPMFSLDFSNIVYLGSTVTYIGLQLAYHLGCDRVYLLGVDHNYGELPKKFPPGKIVITEENIEEVRRCHFSSAYYKVGDVIGVPNVEAQEDFYRHAREVYEAHGRRIYNVGVDSHLDVFERADFASLFA